MLALSTAWDSGSSARFHDALLRGVEAGFSAFTVEALQGGPAGGPTGGPVGGPALDSFQPAWLRKLRLQILAVSSESRRDPESPIRPGLGSPIPGVRDEAVRAAELLVEAAARLQTRTVILSGGSLEIEGAADLGRKIRRSRLMDGPVDDAELDAWRREAETLVREAQDAYLDGLCRSLHRLTRRHPEVQFALLPGARFYELPDAEQLDLVFAEVRASNLYYWHDSASCHVLERLGFGTHQTWLEAHGSRMAGCFLHDYADLESHRPCGQGEVDFKMVSFYLPRDGARSLWLAPTCSVPELRGAVAWLEKCGIT